MVTVDRNSEVGPGGESTKVQDEVVNRYLANKCIVDALGRSFGFKCLFFWQPTVYTKANPTRYEAAQGWLPGDKEFLDGIHQRIATLAEEEQIHDLSAVFGNSAQPYFIDEAHLTEQGNRVVAQGMLPYVLAAIKEKAEETSPGAPAAPSVTH